MLNLGSAPPSAFPRRRDPRGGKPRGKYAGSGQVRSDPLENVILDRIAFGETLSEICRDPHIGVTEAGVRKWAMTDPSGFGARYAQAREFQAEAWSDRIIDIAEDGSLDPQDRRVRIDAKKWLMSKLHHKRYGDKLVVAGDPDAPIVHIHQISDLLATMGPAEIDALERFTEARLQALEALAIDVTPEDSETPKK